MDILVAISQHFNHYSNKSSSISYKYLVLKKLKFKNRGENNEARE
ncbi:hypothetical protein [Clostridium sp.]